MSIREKMTTALAEHVLQEDLVRQRLYNRGYSLMRRRGAQFWFVSRLPKTLDQLEAMLDAWDSLREATQR